MRIALVLGISVLAGWIVASADTLEGQGTASGNVVLWFAGTRATATFAGAFSLEGYLQFGEAVSPFSAAGWARGAGTANTSTMDIEAWATFGAAGSTQAGEPITVQGGITLSELVTGADGASGSATGSFFATVFWNDQRYYARGDASGSASGVFVVPKDPLSMELSGQGRFDLAGDLALVAEEEHPATPPVSSEADSRVLDLMPWDPASWPQELLAELIDLLTHRTDPEAKPAYDSP